MAEPEWQHLEVVVSELIRAGVPRETHFAPSQGGMWCSMGAPLDPATARRLAAGDERLHYDETDDTLFCQHCWTAILGAHSGERSLVLHRVAGVEPRPLSGLLDDWTDSDIARYAFGRVIGLFGGEIFDASKRLLSIENAMGNGLQSALMALVAAGVLEHRDEPYDQYRWATTPDRLERPRSKPLPQKRANARLSTLSRVDYVRTSDSVVVGLEKRFKGRDTVGLRVDAVFSYGAVDIDPQNLVVWVLLSGRPDGELPEWYFPASIDIPSFLLATPLLGGGAGTNDHLGDGVVPACRSWAEEIRGAFALSGWPASESIRVGFDSSHRVKEGGGWNYFK